MNTRRDGDADEGRKTIRTMILLALWTGSVVLLSLWPIGPLATSWNEFTRELASGIGPSVGWPIWETVAERLLAFLPIGFLLYGWLVRLGVGAPAARAFAVAVAIAAAVEIAQAAVLPRHPRLSDLALAVVAAALGVILGRFLRRNQEGSRMLFVGLFAAGSLLATAIPALSQFGLRIGGWDCRYPLILGNELTGNRPWRGAIEGFAIYPRALPDTEIRAMAAGSNGWNAAPRMAAGAVLVSHSADAPLRFGSGAAGVPIVTLPPAMSRTVCEAIAESRAFTVELVLQSADPDQHGPARIVSMSQDTMLRNFTVGQEGAEVVLRVRTPRSGPNGIVLERRTSNRALRPGLHHIVARYDDAGGAIFVDGATATRPVRYRDALFVPPFEYRVPVGWIVALVGLGAGACAALAFPRLGRKVLLATAATGALSAAIAGTAAAWPGGGNAFLLVAAAVSPSLGGAVALALRPRRSAPAEQN